MLLQPDYRLNWDDEPDFAPTMNFSDSFKKAFTGIPKLLASEISLDTCAVFEGTSVLAGPSVSYESLSIDSFPLHGDYFSLDPDTDVLEFNENGHLIGAEERSEPSKEGVLPPSDTTYFGGDLFASWEDDIFAGALSISELPVQNPAKVASPALPVSPSFETAVVEVALEIVDTELSTPKKSKKSPSKKRSTPSTGPSPRSSKPKSALKDSATPKRQRRHSSKNSVTFALEPQILSFPLDREERVTPSSKLKKGQIGLLSSSTHQLSEAVIRNIFRDEQVVTLSKAENEDDEDVDIL